MGPGAVQNVVGLYLSLYFPDCLVIQFADDTQIVLTGDIEKIHELIERAEHLLRTIKLCFQKNGLLINEKKTQCILLGQDSMCQEYLKI